MFKNPIKEKEIWVFNIYTYIPIYVCYVYVKLCEHDHSSMNTCTYIFCTFQYIAQTYMRNKVAYEYIV